jgi:hypothetical protein
VVRRKRQMVLASAISPGERERDREREREGEKTRETVL